MNWLWKPPGADSEARPGSDFVILPLAQEDEVFPAEIATVAIKPMQPGKQKASRPFCKIWVMRLERLFAVLVCRLFWAL